MINKFGLDAPAADLSEWERVVDAKSNPDSEVNVAMVGKYMDLKDSYISLTEALIHGGIQTGTRVKIHYLEAQQIEQEGTGCLQSMDAILVPGGFGDRGIEGKVEAVRFARERGVPYLGICLGMQVAVIEFARNVANLSDAQSTEFDPAPPHPVVALITEWQDRSGIVEERDDSSELGGTMRLGAQKCVLKEGTMARAIYQADDIMERHRHRYEFNNNYMDRLSDAGLCFSGMSVDNLVEIVELPDHPWFLACQFHPEFTSTPRYGHPLFSGFINAAREFRADRAPKVAQA